MNKGAPWIVLILLLPLMFGCSSSGEKTTLSMNHWDFELDKDSPIYREISTRVSVDLIPLSAPWSEWPGKLNVMIASGEVPDIFVTTDRETWTALIGRPRKDCCCPLMNPAVRTRDCGRSTGAHHFGISWSWETSGYRSGTGTRGS